MMCWWPSSSEQAAGQLSEHWDLLFLLLNQFGEEMSRYTVKYRESSVLEINFFCVLERREII